MFFSRPSAAGYFSSSWLTGRSQRHQEFLWTRCVGKACGRPGLLLPVLLGTVVVSWGMLGHQALCKSTNKRLPVREARRLSPSGCPSFVSLQWQSPRRRIAAVRRAAEILSTAIWRWSHKMICWESIFMELLSVSRTIWEWQCYPEQFGLLQWSNCVLHANLSSHAIAYHSSDLLSSPSCCLKCKKCTGVEMVQ